MASKLWTELWFYSTAPRQVVGPFFVWKKRIIRGGVTFYLLLDLEIIEIPSLSPLTRLLNLHTRDSDWDRLTYEMDQKQWQSTKFIYKKMVLIFKLKNQYFIW